MTFPLAFSLLLAPTVAFFPAPKPDGDSPPIADEAQLYVMTTRKIDVPITYDPAQKARIKELHLYVSQDRGKKWTKAMTALPGAEWFTYEAPTDGAFSFALVIIDKNGRQEPKEIDKMHAAFHVLFVQ